MGINNNIYAITVSKNYSKILRLCIETNLKYFKKWFIATQEDDTDTINLLNSINDPRIELVFYPLNPKKQKPEHQKSLLTDAEDIMLSTPDYLEPKEGEQRNSTQQKYYDKLTKDGVIFDKGGALRQIQKYLIPKYNLSINDYILMIDSDVVLPDDLHDHLSKENVKSEEIYVCRRKNYLFYSDYIKGGDVIDKNSMVGAGYFQLYKYDPTKLCKRTHTAGWVDWEFKQQFKYTKFMRNLVVSHLGETDMNWSGKKCETFLMDAEIEEYCKQNKLQISADNNYNKRSIINSIRMQRLNGLERKRGLPNYILLSPAYSDVNKIQKLLNTSHNISFFQQTYPTMSFFGTMNSFNELWDKKFMFYLKSFPKITNHNWIDTLEVDLSQGHKTKIIKERFREVFCDKVKVWREFNVPKIILCVNDPIIRSYNHYQFYVENFPASHDWNWKNPVRSFEENILIESDDVDGNSTFIQNSYIINILDWLMNEVGILLKDIIFVNMNSSRQRICDHLEKYLNVNLDSSVVSEHGICQINSKTRQKLAKYFYQENLKLKKYTGINYNE